MERLKIVRSNYQREQQLNKNNDICLQNKFDQHQQRFTINFQSLICSIARLPRDILLIILLRLLIDTETNIIEVVTELSCVCKRWRNVCQDRLIWQLVAKRVFVAYPLIIRLKPFGTKNIISQSAPKPKRRGLTQQAVLQQSTMATKSKVTQTFVPLISTLFNIKQGIIYKQVRNKNNISNNNNNNNNNNNIDIDIDIDKQGILKCSYWQNAINKNSNSLSSQDVLEKPTSWSLRGAMRSVQLHVEQQRFYIHVQQQRSFVLHILLSLTLLSFALFITNVMFTAQGFVYGVVCSKTASFTLLWITQFAIAAMVITNVIMQAHFEPQPLVQRWRRNWSLIKASSATILLGICDVVVPTVLIEVNLSYRPQQRFQWVWCGITVIVSFCAWQLYTLIQILPDAKQQLQHQLVSVNVKKGVEFMVTNVPNAFPLLYAMATFCTLQYIQYGNRLYVLVGGVPVVVSLLVLSLVFLLDYSALHRSTDLSVGMCLFGALFCPLSFIIWGFHGWCLLPLALSSFGFYIAHARYVYRRAVVYFATSSYEKQNSNVS